MRPTWTFLVQVNSLDFGPAGRQSRNESWLPLPAGIAGFKRSLLMRCRISAVQGAQRLPTNNGVSQQVGPAEQSPTIEQGPSDMHSELYGELSIYVSIYLANYLSMYLSIYVSMYLCISSFRRKPLESSGVAHAQVAHFLRIHECRNMKTFLYTNTYLRAHFWTLDLFSFYWISALGLGAM